MPKTTTVTNTTVTVETPDAMYDFKSKTNMYAAINYIGTQIDYIKAFLTAKPNIKEHYNNVDFIKQFKTIGVNGPRGYGFTTLAKGLAKAYKGVIVAENWHKTRQLEKEGYDVRTAGSYVYWPHNLDTEFIIVDDAGKIPVEHIEKIMEINGTDKFYILIH